VESLHIFVMKSSEIKIDESTDPILHRYGRP